MLILASILVTVLPDLMEVVRVEELDGSIESCGDQTDIFDVFQRGDGILGRLLRVQIRLGCLAVVVFGPFFSGFVLEDHR